MIFAIIRHFYFFSTIICSFPYLMIKYCTMDMIKKNEIVRIEIIGMTTEGSGVGRYNGLAVFVPLAAIGDTLDVKILKAAKNYAYGKIETIITPSPDRIDADCPYFSKCGGCCYRHIRYDAELGIKRQSVIDAMKRIGGFEDVRINPIIGAAGRNSYRNKALLPVGVDSAGKMNMGFYAFNSHRIIDCEACLLQPEEFNLGMEAFRDWYSSYGDSVYNEASHTGKIRRVFMRKADNGIMAGIVINSKSIKNESELFEAFKSKIPHLKSFIINSNTEKTNVALGKRNRVIFGNERLTDILCELRISFSPLSFYQVNRAQAEKLYAKAAEYAALTGDETVIDLYCGVGAIGLSMAHQAKKIVGVEIIESSIENARFNAEQNGIDNAEFICGDTSYAAEILQKESIAPDVVIVDPPRKGCDESLLITISKMAPKRIVYVSCNPATLARDLKILSGLGYTIKELTPVDMFPATSHVECVAVVENERY